MADPITLAVLTAYIVKNASFWFASLRGPVLDQGRSVALDKGKELAVARADSMMQRIFKPDEKEQLRHLQQVLKNATERGLATFDTLQERDQYKDILRTLSQQGPQGEALRREIMQCFTLTETPDLAALSDKYNQRQRFYDAKHQDIDAAPYLNSFFNALLGELYADPYFRPQLSDVLQLRAAKSMQQSLLDIVDVLKSIGEKLDETYSAEDCACDIAIYTEHIERTLRNLKIVGVVPKDQNSDPELSGVFVPLRIAMNERTARTDQQADSLVEALEQYPCLVLLGGPGSGKSTATKHLAWSHAAANQSQMDLGHTPLLSGNPLPLRIELRRLNEERKRANYDFLSFVTEVLLKREGIEIDPRMFKELLTRRCMLLLFDGLDEVTTLDERLSLVNEIEHFTLSYPGNRVLVTSRPVGYELARISHPLFAHAQVQGFNEEQIQQFLENWYTAVLRLTPIPQREREELDLLLTTLKGNPRLHKLAENPLLLTVITQLHRYERLPDRRVLVYDRCADLLLETWARLRGTKERWKDVRMVKEDQYACVAYLGFVLHERSQEETSDEDEGKEDTTVDVPSRFLQKNVEDFLRKQKLIVQVAERRTEAKRFIELVQEEAGLIVERGTDENGEPLYSFVHRTFQEYFAAADVYERYQQKEDPKVISKFLCEHLHDPHWSEVILLLLGKLKSTPVTNQLRQILQGKVKSRRSLYTKIVQQDLFFVCDCLVEEIKVENTLVEMVVLRLRDVVRKSRFPEQRREALEYLGKLMLTRQYGRQGSKELITLAIKEDLLDVTMRFEAVQVLYLYSSTLPEERQQANNVLAVLLQHSELSVEQARETAQSLYDSSEKGWEERELGRKMLKELLKRQDLSVEQIREIAESLYDRSAEGSEERELAIGMLRELLERQDLSMEQIRETAALLYDRSAEGSEEEKLAIEILRELLKRQDLSAEQVRKHLEPLSSNSEEGLKGEELAPEMFTELLKRPDLSVEQIQRIAESFYDNSEEGSEEREQARRALKELLKRPDLSVEQIQKTAESLYHNSGVGSEEERFATAMLLTLISRSDSSDVNSEVYYIFRTMVPQFHRLPSIEIVPLM